MTDLEQLLRGALDDAAHQVPVSASPFAELRRPQSRRPRLAVGLAIGSVVVAVALIVVGAVVLSSGNGTSNQPAALANGRAVTLVPTGAIGTTGLKTSAKILQQRLTGLGIKGAVVHAEDRTLLATVPASAVPTLQTAVAAGVLQFRQVLAVTSAASGPVRVSHPVTAARTVSHALLRTFANVSCPTWQSRRPWLPRPTTPWGVTPI